MRIDNIPLHIYSGGIKNVYIMIIYLLLIDFVSAFGARFVYFYNHQYI